MYKNCDFIVIIIPGLSCHFLFVVEMEAHSLMDLSYWTGCLLTDFVEVILHYSYWTLMSIKKQNRIFKEVAKLDKTW
jgi:hypothetical protein